MNRPIGIVDSSVGGLRVMAELARRLPAEDLVYLCDTARAPYGSRGLGEVRRWTEECAYFLLRFDPKLMVMASHTMAAVASEHLRKKLPVPVFAIPGLLVGAAVAVTRSRRVAVLASEAALAGGVYQRLLGHAGVHVAACPVTELSEALEDGSAGRLPAETGAGALRPLLEEALAPARGPSRPAGGAVDTVVLGEAFLGVLAPLFAEVLGPSVAVVEETAALVREVTSMLSMSNLARPSGERGARYFLVSGGRERFRRLGERFLGRPLGRVDAASPQRFFGQILSPHRA